MPAKTSSPSSPRPAPRQSWRACADTWRRCCAWDPASIDAREPLTAFGIDSLMAVELKNRVDRDLGLSVPLVHYLDGSGIGRLAEALLESAAGAPVTNEGALLERLPGMSDDEVDALLTQMLAEQEGP